MGSPNMFIYFSLFHIINFINIYSNSAHKNLPLQLSPLFCCLYKVTMLRQPQSLIRTFGNFFMFANIFPLFFTLCMESKSEAGTQYFMCPTLVRLQLILSIKSLNCLINCNYYDSA